MKSKKLKRALISSIMSLTLCCAMLIGTTHAIMVDSVTSNGHRIVSGTLDVELLSWKLDDGEIEYVDISDEDGDIFQTINEEDTKNGKSPNLDENYWIWEPGTKKYVNFAVKNTGNLKMKYKIGLLVKDAGLAEMLEYGIAPVKLDSNAGTPVVMAETSQEENGNEDAENEYEDFLIEPEEWYSLADVMDEAEGTVAYMDITEEIEMVDAPEEENSTEKTRTVSTTKPAIDHYRLFVRMKSVSSLSEGTVPEDYTNTHCKIDICVIATQVPDASSGEGTGGDQTPTIITVPTVLTQDYIYHFTTVGIEEEQVDDSNEESVMYLTTESVEASSSNARVAITLPDGTAIEPDNTTATEKALVLCVSPEISPTNMDFEVEANTQTLNVLLSGVSKHNKTPFSLSYIIGKNNRLTKLTYLGTGETSENEAVVMFELPSLEDESKTNDGVLDETEVAYEKEYSAVNGYGFDYDPEYSEVTIQSIHQGKYRIDWESIEDVEETENTTTTTDE